ncbi:hypothetical protein V1264_007986 [Littorina saxatilis]|uniref:Uncharacterized protein n=1 Tax=Littorina saxatilis TaxID=31220 RepID=A0AAN9AW23_9CAEN
MAGPGSSHQASSNDWRQIVTSFYPDALTRTYCVPPVHFNRVPYVRGTVPGTRHSALVLQPPSGASPGNNVPAASQGPATSSVQPGTGQPTPRKRKRKSKGQPPAHSRPYPYAPSVQRQLPFSGQATHGQQSTTGQSSSGQATLGQQSTTGQSSSGQATHGQQFNTGQSSSGQATHGQQSTTGQSSSGQATHGQHSTTGQSSSGQATQGQ